MVHKKRPFFLLIKLQNGRLAKKKVDNSDIAGKPEQNDATLQTYKELYLTNISKAPPIGHKSALELFT